MVKPNSNRPQPGRPPSQRPAWRTVTLRLPTTIIDRIDRMAADDKRSRTNQCEVLLEQVVNSLTEKAAAAE